MDLTPTSIGRPAGKGAGTYIPLPYGNLRFPRLARNYMENRSGVIQQGHATPAWSLAAGGNYRTYRPKYLFFIRETRNEDGSTAVAFQKRPVSQTDGTPYVFISWSWVHYRIRRPRLLEEDVDPTARQQLYVSALKSAIEYYTRMAPGESLDGKAYWLSAGCLSSTDTIDAEGNLAPLNPAHPNFAQLRREEANKDVSHASG
jgi:hypothetical protein